MTEVVRSIGESHHRDHPSALLTFLLADIRGYTRYSAEQGDRAAAHLSERFLSICREMILTHGGEVFGSAGDQALAAFTSAHAALHAALALQLRLEDEQRAHPDLPLMAGIGLDTGEGIRIGTDYRGNAINLAARLCSLAVGGEVFASEAVVHVARKVDGITVVDRGEVTLKGLAHPVRVLQIGPEGALPTELPPLQPILVTHPNNLSDESTPFIGRSGEIAEITTLLGQPHVRLVTLLGPGGSGKTRLALQVGMNLLYSYRDGVFFCDLSPLTDPALIPSAIAETLGVKEEGTRTVLESLTSYFREKHLLLVLDNCEQVIEAASEVGTLLNECRELHVVATSRTPLHLAREREYAVAPLPVPDSSNLPPIEQLRQYDAVALFIDRAGAAKHGFSLTPENAHTVAEICAQLDGLPLAIELAAARVKFFSPAALLRRLDHRLKLLTGGARDRPSRQQTLRATIDWSYSLLTAEEQMLLARLSAFSGGSSLAAIEAVSCPNEDVDLMEGTTSLVEKSILRQEGEDEPRFQMLETIREYAAEKLAETGQDERIRESHAQYFLTLAEQAHQETKGANEPEWLARLDRELGNLRAAMSWFLERLQAEDELRLAGALDSYWLKRGYWTEGRRWMEAGLVASEWIQPAVRARVLRCLGVLAKSQGDFERGVPLLEDALALYRDLEDPEGTGMVLRNLGLFAIEQGKFERARTLVEEAVEIAQALGDRLRTAQGLFQIGQLEAQQDRHALARERYQDALTLFRAEGSMSAVAMVLSNLGYIEIEEGKLAEAESQLEESLRISRKLGLTEYNGYTILGLGMVSRKQGHLDRAGQQLRESLRLALEIGSPRIANMALFEIVLVILAAGDAERAARLTGAEKALRERLQTTLSAGQKVDEQHMLARLGGKLSEEELAQAQETGRAMSLDEVILYALEEHN
jgi:predicted ATPase/class 3 adenylate cyclase/Tfp pilus assembly protein PilF